MASISFLGRVLSKFHKCPLYLRKQFPSPHALSPRSILCDADALLIEVFYYFVQIPLTLKAIW